MFLKDPNLHLKLVFLDMEEYRLLNGWSHDKKKGSSRYDRIPTELVEEIDITCIRGYMQFVPIDLPERFTTKDFAKKAHIPLRLAQTVIHILYYVETIERIGKTGNSYLYEVKSW